MNQIQQVWVQKGPDGQILNQGCYTAYYGAKALGITTKFYSSADEYRGLCMNNSEKPHLCVGGINTLRTIIEYRRLQQPEVHSPHEHLPEYLGRNVFETTLGEVRAFKTIMPIFIKPLIEDKTFTGYVVRSNVDLIKLRTLPDNFRLLASEVVNFVSEWRIFINRYAIVNAKNYAGNYRIMPEFELIEYAVNDYKAQKAAYSLDFGITDKGETMLIEINDAFGIAPYGLEPVAYLKLLTERWEEIMTNKLLIA